jgi:hypothetical protein
MNFKSGIYSLTLGKGLLAITALPAQHETLQIYMSRSNSKSRPNYLLV